jgi:hypothetical protein
MQEVLILIVIALAVFYLPRVMGRKSTPEPAPPPALTGRMRLAILATLLWVAGTAALLKPWEGAPLPFVYLGPGPAAVLWGLAWVWVGYQKYRR